MRGMKSILNKKIIVIGTLIVALVLVSAAWGLNHFDVKGSYGAALKRCGQNPVIGSDGIYYAPGPSNGNISYELLSLYDPANLHMSDYHAPKYFCSIEQAKVAGYEPHACCGLMPY